MGKAALTQVGDLDQLFRAAVAGKLDHVHQRGIVILIGDGCILQTGDDTVVLVHAAGGQTHGQTHTLLNDGALQEDVLAQLAFLTGDDGVGDLAHQVVGLLALDVGVSHACHLGEHLTADLDDRGIDSSETHSNSLLALLKTNGLHPAVGSVLPRRAGVLQGTLVTHCCKQRCARDDPPSF